MLNKSILLLAVASLPAPLLAQGPPQAAKTEIPVRSVVLFSSGVGYFEHGGNVRGEAATELRFKTGQINDILKSLVLQDLDGGKVSTITYPSQDPISKTLRSFQVDITNNPSLASLLNQLRGAKVTIASQAEKISGTILGVENRLKPTEKGDPIEVPTLNIITGAMIRAVELPSINSLTLDDAQLQDELTKALVALTQARDQDKKPVTINFTGTGDRRVRIGYVVETPIWKTSYRLLMNDKSASLQGWAIVENQTESDWNGISLSLVSGRPISFIMDLYQPLYLQRPTVIPELFAGLRPQLYDAGASKDLATNAFEDARTQQRTAPGAAGGRGGGAGQLQSITAQASQPLVNANKASSSSENADYVRSVQSVATAGQLGELFAYAIPNVTLARQKSAMLPIVTDTVGIERLSIYNASVLPRNPLNGVRLKNTTGKHLLQGPITVLDKNSYAGDSRIDNVPPGQERLLSYGVDLELLVDNSKNTSTSAVVTGKINKGMLEISRKFVSTQDYQIENKGAKDKPILIEHPIRQGWKLVETIKPVETTPVIYRFQGNAVAGKLTVLTIKEENVRSEFLSMLPADISQLITYSRTGEIPQPVKDAIARAVQLKQAMLDTDQQINDHSGQIGDITQEQERIRDNMKTVDAKSDYYNRLLAKLNEQETTIERLQKERDALLAKRDTQRKALEDYLSNLTIG